MSSPPYLKILGSLFAGFLSLVVLFLVPIAYWLGKREWRQDYNSYQIEAPLEGSEFVVRNILWVVVSAVPIAGFVGGYFLVDLWYMHGARVAASEAGMTK